MNYTVVEVRCDHCSKIIHANSNVALLEGVKYEMDCTHCEKRTQLKWCWTQARLSFSQHLGLARLEPVEEKDV